MPTLRSIYAIGAPNHPIKIGISICPGGRLNELRVGSPHEISVLHARRTKYAERGETLAHALASPYRLRGEWFRITPEEAVIAIDWAVWHLVANKGRWPSNVNLIRQRAGLEPVIDKTELSRQLCRKLFVSRSPEDYEREALGYG